MATVYITKELVQRVKSNIDRMRRAERASDLPEIDKNHNVDASKMFNIGCWGADNIGLMQLIPNDWLTALSVGEITITGWTEEATALKTSIRFDGLKSAFSRPDKSYYNRHASELTIDQIREFPEETPGRAEALKRWDDAIVERAIYYRWEKVTDDISGFLYKCKSLNEAVKLFPGVRMYIHRDDLERLDRKVERPSQRAKLVESVDTDSLTAAAIAAKLAEAS